jgi:hypothetical protein
VPPLDPRGIHTDWASGESRLNAFQMQYGQNISIDKTTTIEQSTQHAPRNAPDRTKPLSVPCGEFRQSVNAFANRLRQDRLTRFVIAFLLVLYCEVIDKPPLAGPLSQWNLVLQGYYLVVCRLEPENRVLEIPQASQRSRSNRQLSVVAIRYTGS